MEIIMSISNENDTLITSSVLEKKVSSIVRNILNVELAKVRMPHSYLNM